VNVRPATPADAEAVADLFGALEVSVLGHRTSFDAETVRGWWQTIAYETNTWLFEEGGRLVAAAGGQVFDGSGNSAGGVHPDAQGRGLGAQLLELTESRFVEEGATRMHSWTIAKDERGAALFAGRGFHEVRRFWDMAIDLAEEPPQPAIAAEIFEEKDAPGFHAALEESFSDHWNHSPEPFEKWWSRQRERANYDPTLWFLIREGDEIVAVCRNEARPSGGYVGALGVLRRARGRGYARALLQHSFREFHRRGLRHASLGVDASNATGATKLYESVGMYVEVEHIVWEKMLA
jgi:ribosomal protein S18 acetylase RimI-like enzyme